MRASFAKMWVHVAVNKAVCVRDRWRQKQRETDIKTETESNRLVKNGSTISEFNLWVAEIGGSWGLEDQPV